MAILSSGESRHLQDPSSNPGFSYGKLQVLVPQPHTPVPSGPSSHPKTHTFVDLHYSSYQLGSGEARLVSEDPINDGEWHRVTALR